MLKNRSLLAVIGLTSALLFNAAGYAAEEQAAQTGESSVNETLPDPVAVVNGEPITKEMYRFYAEQRQKQLGDINTAGARQAIIDELITQLLLAQQAKKQNLDENPQVALQMEMVKRNLLATAAVRDFLQEHTPSEEAIQEEYEKVTEEMKGKEYKARHILVDTEEEAKDIIVELDQGADFSELAKEHSKDTSGAEGGDLGWFTKDLMVKPFGDAVAVQEIGKYSAEPVETQFGWHVVIVDEVRNSEPPPLTQVKPQITQLLQSRMINEYLENLREKAEVEIKADLAQ